MSANKISVRAELDVPGETTRQGRVLLIWLACLLAAVALVVARRPSLDGGIASPSYLEQQSQWQRERLLIAFGIGLTLPGLLTWWATKRRRRGGPHAREIRVEVTPDGELRVWGRGYGQRVTLAGATCSERLVDVFTGRMGAWRQRRMVVRGARPVAGHSSELELAMLAEEDDASLGLRRDGGEGDCIELSREDYFAVLAVVQTVVAAD